MRPLRLCGYSLFMAHSTIHRRLTFARRYVRHVLADRRTERCRAIQPAPHRPDPSAWLADRLTVSWLGHASVLMNFADTWLLTDPALRPRIGVGLGLGTVGPRRYIGPALEAHELPRLDALLISHAHMDHLDLGTLRRLPRDTPVVAHRALSDLLGRFRHVIELGWGESTVVGGVRIEAIPSKHWGARMVTDIHRGYGGFLLEKYGTRVVFSGDTAATDLYRPIGRRGPVDLAMLPIGGYDPWIDNHANPEEAWTIGRDLAARYVMPIHHSTFRLSREPMDEPIRRFLQAAGEERGRIVAIEIGDTWGLPG